MAAWGGSNGGAAASVVRVLLVDDDEELAELLRDYLADHGVRVEAAPDGRLGLAQALSGGYDLVLLDVMMPGLDGFEVLRLLRRQSRVPVIMLTARDGREDQVAGLDAGADDYLPKPFGTEVLVARIRAVLRRATRPQPGSRVIERGGLRLDTSARAAYADGAEVVLTTLEYEILEFLAHAAGRIVSRDELTAALYRRRSNRYDRALDVHISNLRKKLGSHASAVRTVRGMGYLFAAGADPSGAQ